MVRAEGDLDAALGIDPEEAHLPADERLLQGVAWLRIDDMREDSQISQVIQALGLC